LGEIIFGGADVLAGEEGFGAKIRAQASSFWNNTTNDYPTDLLFFTQPDGGASGLAERLRITSAGNIGIGTTSPYAKLSVAGSVVAASFVATTTATSTFAGGITIGATGAVFSNSGTTTVQDTNGINLGNGSHGIRVIPGSSTTTLQFY
jgi:hypothetical protein